MYLLANAPDIENVKTAIDYQEQLDSIEKLSEKDIELSQNDIDLARTQGRSLSELKDKRLVDEKKILISQLNHKFGIIEQENIVAENKTEPTVSDKFSPTRIFDILKGKGLV